MTSGRHPDTTFTYDRGDSEADVGGFSPILVGQVELTEPIELNASKVVLGSDRHQMALVLVRLHTRPLGVVHVPLVAGSIVGDVLAKEIWAQLSADLLQHLVVDGLPEVHSLPVEGLVPTIAPRCCDARAQILDTHQSVAVIIPTHERADRLAECLDSLLAGSLQPTEIIVVDNVPATSTTEDVVRSRYGASGKVRYVREDRYPGSAAARNRGLRNTHQDFVAFTDDDVLIDQHWLAELMSGFLADPNVGCVTGLIMPRELETPAQLWFEQYGGFGKAFARRSYDLGIHRPTGMPLFPYNAGMFGSGNSMAFKREVLADIGGFDPRLGNGTPTLGGGDVESFFRVIMAGYQLAYEPGAIIHHVHRREYAALKRQIYAYGVGLTAYLTKSLVAKPSLVLDILRRAPVGLRVVFGSNSSSTIDAGLGFRKSAGYPRELDAIERKGMMYGVVAYARSVRRMRQLRRH